MTLFTLPDPQILRVLIDVDGVERLVHKVLVKLNSYKNSHPAYLEDRLIINQLAML